MSKSLKILLVCGFCLTRAAIGLADAPPVALELRIILAHNQEKKIDPRLKDLAATLSTLRFSAFELKTATTFNLGEGTTFRTQLPNSAWLEVTTRGLTDERKLRLDIEVKQIKFKTTVAIAAGATLAVGGPAYEAGTLILALTRPAPVNTTTSTSTP
jgi:hypothetical protein